MTAVEWLFAQMSNVSAGFVTELNELEMLQQAKEMEKEQMIEFACDVYDKYNFGNQEISFREECEQFKSE